MDDEQLLGRIQGLYHEEERLYSEAADAGLSEADKQRLAQIKVQLDQAYDLLHQRQARRAAGLDPEGAHLRPIDVVENYEQ
jgi:hypothetical protein